MAVCKMLHCRSNLLTNFIGNWWASNGRNISKSRLVTEHLGLPVKPKRPLNPYMQFVQNERPETVAKYPNMSPKEIIKTLGKQWSALSESEKNKYIREYKEESELYKARLEDYEKSLSREQKKEIQNISAEIKASKSQKVISKLTGKLQKSLNKPKAPKPPFIRFCQEKGFRSGQSVTSSTKDYAEEWKNLSANKKEKYKVEFEREYQKYLKDLEEWEKQMIQEGNVNQIRVKTLKEMLKVCP